MQQTAAKAGLKQVASKLQVAAAGFELKLGDAGLPGGEPGRAARCRRAQTIFCDKPASPRVVEPLWGPTFSKLQARRCVSGAEKVGVSIRRYSINFPQPWRRELDEVPVGIAEIQARSTA
jgi:hypothetical protein